VADDLADPKLCLPHDAGSLALIRREGRLKPWIEAACQ
jgi:hypothetical protein